MGTLCLGDNGYHVCLPSLPPMLLCGFESQLGLESLSFSMWHFLKLFTRGFVQVLLFPPLLHWFNGSANKIKLKQMRFKLSNLIAELSLCTTWHFNMLHVMSSWCVACDLHTIAPRPLDHTYWRQFTAQWGDCKQSRIAALNAIMIAIFFITHMIAYFGISASVEIVTQSSWC